MLTKRSVLLAKIESTYNTDPTPAAANDAVAVENLSWGLAGLRMVDRNEIRPSMGKLRQEYGGALLEVTFDVSLKGSGTAGTPPELDPILRACGLGVTNVPSTSDTYAPASSSLESCTLYLFEDGQRMIVTGCRGNISNAGPAGEALKISVSLTGHFAAPTDVSLPTPTLDSTVAPKLLSSGFTVDSYAAVISALAFDLGNTVSTPPDINAADGFGEIRITERDVQGSIDPERVVAATKNFFTDFTSGSAMALSTGVLGSSAGNRVQITMPAISYRNISPGDRDGIRIYELPFGAHESSGDDEISIAFS